MESALDAGYTDGQIEADASLNLSKEIFLKEDKTKPSTEVNVHAKPTIRYSTSLRLVQLLTCCRNNAPKFIHYFHTKSYD